MKHHRGSMGDRFKALIAYDPIAGLRKKRRQHGGRVNLSAHIGEQAKVVDTAPTEGQKEAGNYRKGHVKVHGLDISIENPRGSFRSGVADGKPWKSRLPHHYGYIRKTEGGDGDHVDVYLGPHVKAPNVYIIDQHGLKGGREFDEHKCFIGFGSAKQAENAYHRAFSDGKGRDRIGHVETMTFDDFKDWLRNGNTTAPVKNRADGGRVTGMIEPGNIDLNNRPVVHNADGSISTVRSIGANIDGRETLLPTVYGQSVLSDDDAIRLYRMSGKHLGQFDTPENSDAYAQSLHEDQARMYQGRASGGAVEHMAEGGAPAYEPPDAGGPPPYEPPEPDSGKLNAAWQGAKAGATFNFNDEIAGVRGAAPKIPGTDHDIPDFVGPIPARTIAGVGRLAKQYITGETEAGTAYEKSRDEERAASAISQKQHPYIYGAGEIAGSLPAMAALPEAGLARGITAATTKAAKIARTIGDSAVLGGEYGALSGAGEGTDTASRVGHAATGAASGIVGGAVAPVVGEVAGAAYNRLGRPLVDAARGAINPEAEAARRLAKALQADQAMIQSGTAKGMTPQAWAAARQAGEPVTLAELGAGNTQALLRSAANTSPEGRAALEKVIEERFAGQSERVADDVRGLVSGGANAHKTGDQLVAEYDAARLPAYRQAYREGDKEIISPTIERLMGSPMFEGAMKAAVTSGKDRAITEGYGAFNPGVTVDNGLIKFTKTKPNGVPQYPNLQYWDSVKKELDGIATMAKRSGDPRGDVASTMAKTLRTELDNAVPSYGNARGIAAQYFGESNALEAGQKLAGRKVDPKEIRDVMAKMKPDEKELFREGYASDWAGRVIGNISESRDITKAMFNSPNERARAMAVFGPIGMAKMEARMSLETIMDGARKAMGNSTTARQLIEAGLAGGTLEGYLSGWDPTHMAAGFAGAAGARKAIGSEMAAGARKLVGKVDSKTARLVAELLTSNDPTKLAQGLRMAQKNQRIADGLKRVATYVGLSGQTKAVPRIPIDTTGWGSVAGHASDEHQEPPRP